MQSLDALSSVDKSLLVSSPLLVFSLIAAADGKIDQKEWHEFLRLLECAQSPVGKPDLTSIVVNQVLSLDADRITSIIREKNPVDDLFLVAQVVTRHFRKDVATEFLQEMMELAGRIAEASGSVLGFGSGVSKEEKKALATLRTLFDAGTKAASEPTGASGHTNQRASTTQSSTSSPAASSNRSRLDTPDFQSARSRITTKVWGSAESARKDGYPFVEPIDGVAMVIALDVTSDDPNQQDAKVFDIILERHLEHWGVSVQELFRCALNNSMVQNVNIQDHGDVRVMFTEHSAAITALALDHYPAMMGPFGSVVGIPNRNIILSMPIVDEHWFRSVPGFADMIESFSGDPNCGKPLSSAVYIFQNRGRLHELTYRYDEDDNSFRFECNESLAQMLTSLLERIRGASAKH